MKPPAQTLNVLDTADNGRRSTRQAVLNLNDDHQDPGTGTSPVVPVVSVNDQATDDAGDTGNAGADQSGSGAGGSNPDDPANSGSVSGGPTTGGLDGGIGAPPLGGGGGAAHSGSGSTNEEIDIFNWLCKLDFFP